MVADFGVRDNRIIGRGFHPAEKRWKTGSRVKMGMWKIEVIMAGGSVEVMCADIERIEVKVLSEDNFAGYLKEASEKTMPINVCGGRTTVISLRNRL